MECFNLGYAAQALLSAPESNPHQVNPNADTPEGWIIKLSDTRAATLGFAFSEYRPREEAMDR